jgi:hypothetical protein
MRYRLVLVILLAVLQSSSALSPARVQIVRATTVTWDDEVVVVQIRVEPHAANRALVVAAVDGDLVVRQSTEQLDGETAKRTRWVRWGSLSAGQLLIVVSLFDSGSSLVARDSRPIRVLSRRGEPEMPSDIER